MPEQIRCPSCNAALRVPDTLLGKNVKCPKCKATFVAEMEEPAKSEAVVTERKTPVKRSRVEEEIEDEELPTEEEPEEEEEERPRRRKRRYSEAKSAVAGPAIALIILGSIDVALFVLFMVLRLVGISLLMSGVGGGQGGGANAVSMSSYMVGNIAGSIVGISLATVILLGGVKMKKLENYGLAMTACILALQPCGNCCIIGLPLGIWGLIVLNKPDVKGAFK